MTREVAVKLVRDFAIYHARGDLPYSRKTLEALEMCADIVEKTIGKGRLIDADAASKHINDGAGTPLQKFFADVCLAGEPTVIECEPKSDVDTLIEAMAQRHRLSRRTQMDIEYLPPDDWSPSNG